MAETAIGNDGRFSSRVLLVVERLKEIRTATVTERMCEQAGSLATSIADLESQRAELRGR